MIDLTVIERRRKAAVKKQYCPESLSATCLRKITCVHGY